MMFGVREAMGRGQLHMTKPVLALLMLCLVAMALQRCSSDQDARHELLEALHPEPKKAPSPRGITLLPGYQHVSSTDFEGNKTGAIFNDAGVKLWYEGGFSQGYGADPKEQRKYRWFRSQTVNGHKVYVALDRSNTLWITFPWGTEPDDWQAMNFTAKIRKQEDIVDILLMVLGCEECHGP
jgi:hypothetical protein